MTGEKNVWSWVLNSCQTYHLFFSLLPETIVTFSAILACFFKFEMTMPTSSLQRWEGGKDWRRAEKGREASFSGFVGLRSDSVISAALAGDLKDALFGDSQSVSSLRAPDLEVGCSPRLCHWLLSLWRHLVHRVLWMNFEPGTLWETINVSLSSLALSSITTPRRTAKISPKANILFRLSMQYRHILTIRRWSVFFDNAQQTLTWSATVFDIFTASAPSITHGTLWSSWKASKEELLLIFAPFTFLMLYMLSHQRNIFHLWKWRHNFLLRLRTNQTLQKGLRFATTAPTRPWCCRLFCSSAIPRDNLAGALCPGVLSPPPSTPSSFHEDLRTFAIAKLERIAGPQGSGAFFA